MWCWQRILKVSWTEQVTNEAMYSYQRIRESKVNMEDNRREKKEVDRTSHKK